MYASFIFPLSLFFLVNVPVLFSLFLFDDILYFENKLVTETAR